MDSAQTPGSLSELQRNIIVCQVRVSDTWTTTDCFRLTFQHKRGFSREQHIFYYLCVWTMSGPGREDRPEIRSSAGAERQL